MVKTNDQLHTEINANFPDNTAQQITPALLRTTTLDLTDSAFSYGSYLTANVTVQTGSISYCDTSGGGFSVTLPSSPTVGAIVSLRDAAGTWGTSNLSVLPAGNNIESSAGNLTCDTSGANFDLVWRGGGVGWGVSIILTPWARGITNTITGAAAMHGTSAFAGVAAATAAAGVMHAAGVGALSAFSGSFAAANWNPSDKHPDITLSGSNLIATKTGSSVTDAIVRGTPGHPPSHKYLEFKPTVLTNIGLGLSNSTHTLSSYLGSDSANAIAIYNSGFQVGPGVSASGAHYVVNDIIGVELISNLAVNAVNLYINNAFVIQFATLPPGTLFPAASFGAVSDSVTINLGATPFVYTPPVGAQAWNIPGPGMPSGALGIWYVDQYSSPGIQNDVGSTAVTIAGTADGNLYLAGGTAPSGGILNFNSGEIGSVVLPSSVTLTAATVIYSCHKEANVTTDTAIMADSANYHFWSVGEDISGNGPGFQNSNINWTGQQNGSLWDKVGNGWHISSHSYDASSAECWIDGIKVISNPAGPGSRTIAGFDIGVVNGTWKAGYKINALAIYNRKLSAAEQAAAYNALKDRAALSSITIPATSPEKILFAMGDSITDGSFGDTGLGATNPGYVYAAARTASPVIKGANLGVGGRTIATTNTAFDSTYGPMISAAVATSGRDIICTMALGTNDLLTYPGGVSAWLTDFAALCDKVRATGAKLIVATIIPNPDPTFNARRLTANAAIRTWVGTHADAIMDFASDPIMGLDATVGNGTYFQDGTHPTGAGHALLAPYLVAAENSL